MMMTPARAIGGAALALVGALWCAVPTMLGGGCRAEHAPAPCRDDEEMLRGFPKTERVWGGRTIGIARGATRSCAAAARAGACGWRDERSVYLHPWRMPCPRACGLCDDVHAGDWAAAGGGEPAEDAGKPPDDAGPDVDADCDLDRVRIESVEDEIRVRKKYTETQTPVIVVGVMRNGWENLTEIVRRAVTAPGTLTEEGGRDRDGRDGRIAEAARFLQQEFRRVQHLGYNQYGDLSTYPHPDARVRKTIEAAYTPPGEILGADSGDLLRAQCNGQTSEDSAAEDDWSYHWILIAGQGTSTAYHVDQFNSSAWNTVLEGEKRWIIGPPSNLPPGLRPEDDVENGAGFARLAPGPDAMRTFDYYRDQGGVVEGWGEEMPWSFSRSEYAKKHDKLFAQYDDRGGGGGGGMQCRLRRGETIFVPSGWWHTVYNVKPSIAITENALSPANFPQVIAELMARPRGSRPWLCAEKLVHAYPEIAPERFRRQGRPWRKLPAKWRKYVSRRTKRRGTGESHDQNSERDESGDL